MELFTVHTPPNIEHVFGYQRHRQWVAFFWGRKVDDHAKGYCFDGEKFNPLNQLAWDNFFNHALMVAINHQWIDGRAQKKFELGNALQPSIHWLLLDRQERKLFAALKTNALNHLRSAIQSEGDQASHVPSDPGVSDIPNRLLSPAGDSALQLIAEMTAWLDARKESVKNNGWWPTLS